MLANGYMVEQTTQAAISPSTGRTLPDRYIEGTCPICGYGDARGDQCDNCGNQLDATDLINPRSKINGETPSFVETQHFFLDLPALADALGEWLDEREAERHLAAQRHQVQPEHPQGDPAARDDPRHRLGHPGARAGRTSRPSGSTSGSTRSSATCRPRSSGPRRLGRARALARVVERPGGAVLLLHGQGQHRLPLPDLARRAARLRRPGRPRRRAGGVRRRSTCPPRSSPRSTSRWATSSSPPRAATCSTSATSWPATAPTRCATSSARPVPRRPTRRSRGPTSSPATTPSWSPAGATWSTARPRWSRRASARSRPAATSSRSTRRCWPPSAAASTRSATCSAATGCGPRSPRRCGSSAR